MEISYIMIISVQFGHKHDKYVRVQMYSTLLQMGSRGCRVSTEVTFWHSAEYGSDFRCNSGEIPRNFAEFRGISRNFAGIKQKSLQKSKNSAEFRVGGIPWTPYADVTFCLSGLFDQRILLISFPRLSLTSKTKYGQFLYSLKE